MIGIVRERIEMKQYRSYLDKGNDKKQLKGSNEVIH